MDTTDRYYVDWLGSSDRKKNNNSESSGDNVSKQPATLVAGGGDNSVRVYRERKRVFGRKQRRS